MSSSALHHHVFKTCIRPGIPVPSVVRSEPRHTCTCPWHLRNIILQVAGKCFRNGLKVGMRSYYSVGRPPAKFHHIRSPFDAPTDKYSGSIAGLFVIRFRSPEIVPGCISPLFSQTNPLSTVHLGPCLPLSSARGPPRARVSCPGLDPVSRHRCVRIIPKHLQNVSVLLIGLPCVFFLTSRF